MAEGVRAGGDKVHQSCRIRKPTGVRIRCYASSSTDEAHGVIRYKRGVWCYTSSSTDEAYGAMPTPVLTQRMALGGGEALQPTPYAYRRVPNPLSRSRAVSGTGIGYAAAALYVRYVMSGTELWIRCGMSGTVMRTRYGISGTELRLRYGMSGAAIRTMYGMSGTELGYGATRRGGCRREMAPLHLQR
eukprot:3155678-Rhodomonas_salina.1